MYEVYNNVFGAADLTSLLVTLIFHCVKKERWSSFSASQGSCTNFRRLFFVQMASGGLIFGTQTDGLMCASLFSLVLSASASMLCEKKSSSAQREVEIVLEMNLFKKWLLPANTCTNSYAFCCRQQTTPTSFNTSF